MGLASAYWEYVDEDMVLDPETVSSWGTVGLQEFIEGRVGALVVRWRLMNVYIAHGMERPGTAKVARQVARSTCGWLMHVAEMEAYDWTYKDASGLMDVDESEMRRLSHAAASLDIAAWLGRWREDVLAQMSWYCTVSQRHLAASPGRSLNKKLNRVAHAVHRELEGVVHAINEDQSKPKRRKTADAEEE